MVDLVEDNCQYLPEALWGKGKEGLLGDSPPPVTLNFPSRWCLPYFRVSLRLPYPALDHLPMPLVCGGSFLVPTSLSLLLLHKNRPCTIPSKWWLFLVQARDCIRDRVKVQGVLRPAEDADVVAR